MKYSLKLYITGRTLRSIRSIENLQQIRDNLKGECDMVIIDVLEQPELAEEAKILATPTLVRESPPPPRRVIGDLSDIAKVFTGLDIMPYQKITTGEELA